MSFPQKTFCQCDTCDRWLQRYHDLQTGAYEWRVSRLEEQAHGFGSVRQAHTAATSSGWYVDASTVRCPAHWPELPSPLDDDGYPTEQALQQIRDWPMPDAVGLLEFVRELWSYPRYFVIEAGRLELSTGGWSGNESVVGALMESWFWMLYWRESKAGGHYTLTVPATVCHVCERICPDDEDGVGTRTDEWQCFACHDEARRPPASEAEMAPRDEHRWLRSPWVAYGPSIELGGPGHYPVQVACARSEEVAELIVRIRTEWSELRQLPGQLASIDRANKSAHERLEAVTQERDEARDDLANCRDACMRLAAAVTEAGETIDDHEDEMLAIDEQIDRLVKLTGWSARNDLLATVSSEAQLRDVVDKLEEERRWIPVEERLPVRGHQVWLFDENLGQGVGARGDWSGAFERGSGSTWEVTHWRPLPPLPGDEDE